MKKYVIALAALATTSISSAQVSKNTYKPLPTDASIELVQIKVGGEKSDVQISGVIYDSKFRLQGFSKSSSPVFKISGGPLSKMGKEKFLQECELNKKLKTFDSVQEQNAKNRYTLEGEYYPLNKEAMTEALANIDNETVFTSSEFHPVYFDSDMGDYVKSLGASSMDIFSILDAQIQKQKDRIWNSGKVTLDLTGQDALVCDLVSRKTVLKLGSQLGYPEALPRRTAMISPDELKNVVDKISRQKVTGRSVLEATLISNLVQNDALKEVLNKDYKSFGVENYLKISQGIMDSSTGRLSAQASDSVKIRKLANSLDVLTQHQALENLIVTPEIQVSK